MKRSTKISIILIIIAVISIFSVPTFSKYCNKTVERIIKLFSRYDIEYVTNNGYIYEPDKFSSYLSIQGLVLPTDEEVSRVGYSLGGWYENTDFSGEAIKEIEAGTTGNKKYYANWVISQNPLKVKTVYDNGTSEIGLPEGMALVIGKNANGEDNVISLDADGQIIVPKDEIVSIRIPFASDYSISNIETNIKSIVEREYNEGEQYLYYDFKMPGEETSISYNDKVNSSYIDITKSSIIFEENVSNGSRTENGFWYNAKIKGMTSWIFEKDKGYFYIWDNNKPLYITSNNVETTNQLVLVNGLNVYFKDCKLMARNEYSTNVVGRKLNNIAYESASGGYIASILKFDNVKQYGNIIFSYDNYQTYNPNLYFEGENYVASIFQDVFKPASDNRMELHITGVNSTDILNLGSVWGNFNVYVSNIVLNEYQSDTYVDNSEYLFFINSELSTQGNIYFDNVNLNAPHKRVFSGFGYIYYQGVTTALVNSNRYAYNLYVQGNAFLHNLSNIESVYYGIIISNNASVVLDGNFYTNGYESGGSSINTTGYLIARGNNFNGQGLSVYKGTVIANSLSVEPSLNMAGGTIITNQILNAVNKRMTYDSNGYIAGFSGLNNLEIANKNDDDKPFITYSNTGSALNKYRITAGKVYLFGEYKVTDTGEYDKTTNLYDNANPVKKYVDILLDNDGNLKGDIVLDLNSVQNDVKNYTKTKNNECIMLGNSAYEKNVNKGREFIIGENAFIYAAGNLNFYNELTVNGGTIYAGGTLSSKHDLTIKSGSNIEAQKIGNKYNLTSLEDTSKRWKTTNILGGTVKTNELGAIDDASKSTINISNGSVIPLQDKIIVNNDIYVNYYYNDTVFNYTPEINNLRFKTEQFGELTTLDKTNQSLNAIVSITNPSVKNGNNGYWLYDSLNGSVVTTIEKNGDITGTENSVLSKDYLSLYAVKESYNLSVAEGIEYISLITENNQDLGFSSTNLTNNVASTKNITITLNDSSMMDKVVVAYQDDSGIYHTPNITKDSTANTITFAMPYADTKIYVTNDLTLHLDKYNVEITKTGFNTGIGVTSEDLMFDYSGNIIITQSTTKATANRVLFATGSGNMNSDSLSRNIIIKNIYQTGTGANYGVEIKDGENVKLTISGINRLYPIKSGGDLTIVGENGKATDSLSLFGASLLSYHLITVNSGSTTIVDGITINQNTYSGFFYGNLVYTNGSNKAKEVIFRNSAINAYFYAYCGLGYNIENLIYENSELNLIQYSDTASQKFSGVNKVTFINSNVKETNIGGNRKSQFIDMGTKEIEMIDSSYASTIKNSTNSVNNYIYTKPSVAAKKITLRGNSSFASDYRMIVNSLTLYDNSQVKFDNPDGYLLCPDIEVNDNASINASHIIVSGFYYPSGEAVLSKTEMFKLFAQGKDILDGNKTLAALGTIPKGLVINGGTVTATEFVGGDVNSKITINGGVLNGNKIGTIGKLYGFTEYNPKIGEEWLYEYERIPAVASLITLNDGVINVSSNGYLGGANASVDINGGEVYLASDAILGITESDKTKMLNYTQSLGLNLENLIVINIMNAKVEGETALINAPYGHIDITGENSSIKVKDMLALKGNISIKDSNNNYDNPYVNEHGEVTHNKVGIIIGNKLSALNITISNGAIVYAKNAIANAVDATDTGLLKVSYDTPISYLYSDYYGTDGLGHSTVDVKDNALLERLYSIHYNLNDNYEDKATNLNPLNYSANSEIVLQDASRYGYDFVGWFDSEGNQVTTITGITGDVYLEARWLPKKVKFKVSINYNDIKISKEELQNEVDLSLGMFDASKETFTFTEEVEVDYKDLIGNVNNVRLDNYNLKSYKAISIKINDNNLNPNGIDIDLNSKVVTKDILDSYLTNGVAIDLRITGVAQK